MFESIIDRVIVGEKAENGAINPYKLKFIFKTGYEKDEVANEQPFSFGNSCSNTHNDCGIISPQGDNDTVVTGRHELKVPNKLQKRVYDDFQEVKKYQGMSLSDAQQKKINSLRGRIQASENIENGKFPKIKRLSNMIGQV